MAAAGDEEFVSAMEARGSVINVMNPENANAFILDQYTTCRALVDEPGILSGYRSVIYLNPANAVGNTASLGNQLQAGKFKIVLASRFPEIAVLSGLNLLRQAQSHWPQFCVK